MARNDRTVRLEVVKKALAASRRGVALKTLAERHGWPLRTLYRDVEALEAAGYNIIRGDGVFRLDDTADTSLSKVSAEERLALYVAREQARGWKATALGRALDSLWNRLSSAGDGQAALVPVESAPWISVREWSGVDYGRHRHIVQTLERAVQERRVLQARYKALSTKQVTSRVIEPGQLHWDPALETLYLIGWCRLRADVRIFAVHRFLAAAMLDERCAPRAETRSKAALKNAFRVWRGENVEAVRIWFAPEVAEEIKERRRWLPSQRLEDTPDGGVVLSGEVAGVEELERWVLGYGGRARALAPRRLAEAVAAAARAAAGGYGDGAAVAEDGRRRG